MSGLLASDAERDAAVERLRVAAAEGRLDASELDARVEAALRARTASELEPLLADLPEPRARRSSRRRTGRRPEVAVCMRVVVLLIVIWALTGAGYFWPVWPMLGWGLGLWLSSGGCGRRRRRPRSAAPSA